MCGGASLDGLYMPRGSPLFVLHLRSFREVVLYPFMLREADLSLVHETDPCVNPIDQWIFSQCSRDVFLWNALCPNHFSFLTYPLAFLWLFDKVTQIPGAITLSDSTPWYLLMRKLIDNPLFDETPEYRDINFERIGIAIGHRAFMAWLITIFEKISILINLWKYQLRQKKVYIQSSGLGIRLYYGEGS